MENKGGVKEAGYAMVWPAQPAIGGKSEGSAVIVFNPYLEAGFGLNSTFGGISEKINTPTNGLYKTQYGIQTNCMSCHGHSSWRIEDKK